MEASKYMQQKSWGLVRAGDGGDSESIMSSSFDDSINSEGSSSSIDLQEDASSSTSSLGSSHDQGNNGPLYGLSELMAHLPIKRGLSLHFQGKSQSFTSLSHVRSIEDLVKRENPYRKRMKSCKSYGTGLDGNTNKSYTPSKKISKKTSRGSFWCSTRNTNNPNNSPRSPFSLVNNF